MSVYVYRKYSPSSPLKNSTLPINQRTTPCVSLIQKNTHKKRRGINIGGRLMSSLCICIECKCKLNLLMIMSNGESHGCKQADLRDLKKYDIFLYGNQHKSSFAMHVGLKYFPRLKHSNSLVGYDGSGTLLELKHLLSLVI